MNQILKNQIATCDIALSERLAISSFTSNKTLGSIILINRVTNMTSACGVIDHTLRRSSNIKWQKTDITRNIRAKQKDQTPLTIWFTGLSGSGKSVLANALEVKLVSMGKHTMLLDGDNIRHGLNRDLGFNETGRVENIRRVAEVSKLINDAGIIVLAAFISPYERDRQAAKEIIGKAYFREIYVSTPLEVCEQRDVKGLYKKARKGEIPGFTGVSGPYEKPESPILAIDTSIRELNDAIDELVALLF